MAQRVDIPGVGILEFPDGMSQPDMAAAIRKNFPEIHQPAAAAPPAPPGNAPSTLSGVGMGLGDAPLGIGQMAAHAMDTAGKADPYSIMGLMDKVRRASASVQGRGAESADVDKAIAEREAAYQASRASPGLADLVTGKQPSPGIDWPRMGGNMLGALALPGAGATTLAGRAGLGALQGAALGAVQPVATGDYAGEKMKQMGLGALTGGIATPALGALGDVIAPKVSANVKTLMDAGVTPTPGKILGGAWAKAEDKLTSLPLVGDAISAGQRRAINEYNTATYNQALAPIGKTAEKGVTGPEGVLGVKNALGDAYNTLLPKLTFKPDAQLAAEVDAAGIKAQRSLPLDQARIFTNAIEDLRATPTPNGTLTGQAYQDLMSDLGKNIKSYTGSQMASERNMGLALADVRDSMKAALERSNPKYAEDLSAINLGYANYARIRAAGAALGKDESGVFTPAQLLRSVQVQDRSVGKGDFATGKAFMQDWAQAGKNVLGAKYPDSGTAGRAMLSAGAAGGLAMLSPTTLGGAGLASLMYTGPGQKLMAAILTKRPAWAPGLAGMVQQGAPLLPAAAPGLLQAYNN